MKLKNIGGIGLDWISPSGVSRNMVPTMFVIIIWIWEEKPACWCGHCWSCGTNSYQRSCRIDNRLTDFRKNTFPVLLSTNRIFRLRKSQKYYIFAPAAAGIHLICICSCICICICIFNLEFYQQHLTSHKTYQAKIGLLVVIFAFVFLIWYSNTSRKAFNFTEDWPSQDWVVVSRQMDPSGLYAGYPAWKWSIIS